MDLTLVWATQMAVTTAVVAFATLRLSPLVGEPTSRVALVPFANILLLSRLLGIDHGVAVISGLLVVFLSPTLVFVLPFLAGRYAARTGRKRWVGWILSLPPFLWLGLLLLAATVSRRRVESVGSARA